MNNPEANDRIRGRLAISFLGLCLWLVVGMISLNCSEKSPVTPINRPPTTPTLLEPSQHSVDQSIVSTLKWNCLDPDGDSLFYNVYLDSVNSPHLVSSGQTSTVLTLPALAYATKYYWCVVARDSHGDSSSSQTGEFTTKPTPRWSTLGTGTSGTVLTLSLYDRQLVAGGMFRTVAGFRANNIVSWDGISWSPLGNGLSDFDPNDVALVYGTLQYGSLLIACGWFRSSGNDTMLYIASWNGACWSDVGGGMRDATAAPSIGSYHGNLIAGGIAFYGTESVLAIGVAQWNGSNWSPLGSGLSDRDDVRCFAVYRGELVVGGRFAAAGGVPASNIAAWNGKTWSALGLGTNAAVGALVVFGDRLVASGHFTEAGGRQAGHIAVWDGESWSPLGEGMDDGVHSLTVFDGQLIAGGAFTVAGSVAASHIAAWTGSSWSPLDAGIDGNVWSLAVYNEHLIAGGQFDMAGGNPAKNIASWGN